MKILTIFDKKSKSLKFFEVLLKMQSAALVHLTKVSVI